MVQAHPAHSKPSHAGDEAAIRRTLALYNDALNSGSTEAAMTP
jgi:hypothetical protein